MIQQMKRSGRFNPQALPIALKIVGTLGLLLVVGALIIRSMLSGIIAGAQTDIVQHELAAVSQDQAESVVDTLDDEIAGLRELGTGLDFRLGVKAGNDAIFEENVPTFQQNDTVNALAGAYLEAHPELEAIAVVGQTGHVLAATSVVETLPAPGDWDWFEAVFSGQTVLLNPHDDSLTGVRGVDIIIPVYAPYEPDIVAGALVAVWNLDNATSVTPIRQRSLMIAGPGGRVLHQSGTMVELVLSSNLQKMFEDEPSGSFSYTAPDQRDWLYGQTHLADVNGIRPEVAALNWTVAVREPLSVTAAATTTLTRRVSVAIYIALAVVLIFTTGVAYLVLRPLSRLTAAADHVRAGELETPIPHLPQDEVGRLADILRDLVTRLLGRLKQLDAAVAVSRVTVRSLDVDQLLEDAMIALVDEFELSGARVYLTDESFKYLYLAAAMGAVNSSRLKERHTVPIDEHSHVGRAVMLAEAQLATMPGYSLSEVALPLVSGAQILGVLCLTARRDRDFDMEDIDMLSLVADQLSSALQNARLYRETTANVEEIAALNRRLTRRAWEEYLARGDMLRYTRDPLQDWPEVPDEARAATQLYEDEEGRAIIAVPLIVRGQPVGTLTVSRPRDESWTQDERLLLEAVSDRLARLAESVRLVEETSWQAEREQRVNEMAASLQHAATVDEVLQTALERLGDAMGAGQVSLRLGQPASQSADSHSGANGHQHDNENGNAHMAASASADETGEA